MDAKIGHFQCIFFRPLAVALLCWQATVNWPSSSGNLNYANGQTDRILVPYTTVEYWDSGNFFSVTSFCMGFPCPFLYFSMAMAWPPFSAAVTWFQKATLLPNTFPQTAQRKEQPPTRQSGIAAAVIMGVEDTVPHSN
jgi:hypothetical protein